MLALLWGLRQLQSKINSQNSGRRLQIIESLSIGTRQRVALIRVGEREVLIGISPTQINGIASWPDGHLPALDNPNLASALEDQAQNGVPHVT
jgi:flagellar biosynthetic protein FliO